MPGCIMAGCDDIRFQFERLVSHRLQLERVTNDRGHATFGQTKTGMSIPGYLHASLRACQLYTYNYGDGNSTRPTPDYGSCSTRLRQAGGWKCQPGHPAPYRLAQLDDYAGRTAIACGMRQPGPSGCAPASRTLIYPAHGASVSGMIRSASRLVSVAAGRTPPTLPQTAWFMHASPPNWLSLQNDPETIPANGFFAGTFRSLRIPSALVRTRTAWLYRYAQSGQSPVSCAGWPAVSSSRMQPGVDLDVTQWHEYSIQWLQEDCLFRIDGNTIFRTSCSPRPPLGMVLWIDNQFAAWTPQGRLKYGTLANPAAWLEIENLDIVQE